MKTEKHKIKLYESLFILYKCKNSTDLIWEKINPNKIILKGANFSDSPLLYHIILEVVSFQEEYRNFNSKNIIEYSERINQVRAINKSILKKINKWDLLSFRNNIVAHPWRKDGKFIIPDSIEYNIPRNMFEFQLMINYLTYAWKIIEMEFSKEFESAINYMLNFSIDKKPRADYKNINEEQLKLAEDVNKTCEKFNKNYNLKVFLYDFDE